MSRLNETTLGFIPEAFIDMVVNERTLTEEDVLELRVTVGKTEVTMPVRLLLASNGVARVRTGPARFSGIVEMELL